MESHVTIKKCFGKDSTPSSSFVTSRPEDHDDFTAANKQIPSSILWCIGCAELHLASNKLWLLLGGRQAPIEQLEASLVYFIIIFCLKWDKSSHFNLFFHILL